MQARHFRRHIRVCGVAADGRAAHERACRLGNRFDYGQAKFNERIKTAALALCIAAVRARLAGQKEHP